MQNHGFAHRQWHFDLSSNEIGGNEVLVDVKSTEGRFEGNLHISLNELEMMKSAKERYDLYRVYEMTAEIAHLRIAMDMRSFASDVLNSLNGVPDGVRIDSISVDPAKLDFTEQILLSFDADDDSDETHED